jgi:hypothetical protein
MILPSGGIFFDYRWNITCGIIEQKLLFTVKVLNSRGENEKGR